MAGERIDATGTPSLYKGLWGGYIDQTPTAVRPVEHENPASAEGRQRFFYGAVRELSGNPMLFSRYWQQGGPMTVVMSEFTHAMSMAVRVGQMTEQEKANLTEAYEERTRAFFCMTGLGSAIRNCDGALVTLAEYLPPEVVMGTYGWDKEKSELISHDPAIAWPLSWIRAHAESGALLRSIYLHKERSYLSFISESMKNDPGWAVYRAQHGIASDMEADLAFIALEYWKVEDLPDLHRRVYADFQDWKAHGWSMGGWTRRTNFTDSIQVRDSKGNNTTIGEIVLRGAPNPKMGILDYDDVYWSNLDRPADVSAVKGAFVDRIVQHQLTATPGDTYTERVSEILDLMHDALTYQDREFPAARGTRPKNEAMQGRIPSEATVKDLKRWAKVGECFFGGPQLNAITDFTKFKDGVEALCNLYATIEGRSEVVGWMLGEIFYVKVKALMKGAGREDFGQQIFKMLNLGNQDTPQELSRAAGGALGANGLGTFGAIAEAVDQFGLNINTPHFNQAMDMIKTGIGDPALAGFGKYVLAGIALLNRTFPSGGGKRK